MNAIAQAFEQLPGVGRGVYAPADFEAVRDIIYDAAGIVLPPGARMTGVPHTPGTRKWYDMSERIRVLVQEAKPLPVNVDFYSASVYYTLGIPIDLFTPIFAISRVAGWTAHVYEQYSDNRLIRPESEYIGPMDVHYEPIESRH